MKKTLLSLLLYSSLIIAQTPLKVLFIGNSFTNTYQTAGDVPTMFRDIAAAGGVSVTIQMQAPNGYWLSDHLATASTINAINSNNWDYVILQEGSDVPSSDYVSSNYNGLTGVQYFTDYVDTLNKIIFQHDSCTQTMLFMTWGWKNGDTAYPGGDNFTNMTHRLDTGYLIPANLYNLKVTPVGRVWQNVVNTSTINLYNSDNYHPNIYGSYLAACSFYSAIYNTSALNYTYVPSGISTTDANIIQTEAANFITYAANRTRYHLNNVSRCNLVTSLKTENRNNSLALIYPNPNNGEFYTVINETTLLTIYNTLGQIVYQNKLEQGKHNLTINSQAKGIYIAEFKTETTNHTLKLIKE